MKKTLIIASLFAFSIVMYGCNYTKTSTTTKTTITKTETSLDQLSDGFAQTRDTNREGDLKILNTALQLSMMESSQYPMPDEAKPVYDEDGELLWYEWVFGDAVSDSLTSMDVKLKDPKTKQYYAYSIAGDKKTYQLKADLESENKSIYNGDYNGYFITNPDNKYYLRKIPDMFAVWKVIKPDNEIKKYDITTIINDNDEQARTQIAAQAWVSEIELDNIIKNASKAD